MCCSLKNWAFQVTQWKTIRLLMQNTWIRSLSQEDPLEKEKATHYNILAWKIHGFRSLAGYSPWGHKSWTQLSRNAVLEIIFSY